MRSEPSLRAWRARQRPSTGFGSGRGSYFCRRMVWRHGPTAGAVGCTTGTASKWRVRYAERRFGGLDETGERGNDPKYTEADDQRILAALDQPVPAGYGRWTGPLIAAALGDVGFNMSGASCGLTRLILPVA